VQFQDVSAQLLISLKPSPIENNFPKPMPHLTIDLNPLMRDTSVTRRMSSTFVDAHIDAIHLAPESLECVVVFHSGELVVYRLSSGPHDTVLYRDASDKEIIILEHISPQSGSKFSPYFMLIPGKGLVTICAISDIGAFIAVPKSTVKLNSYQGFLASAYADGSLLVVDMRGPRIILRRNQDGDQKRHSMGLRLHRHSGTLDPIASLAWTVSTLASGKASYYLCCRGFETEILRFRSPASHPTHSCAYFWAFTNLYP
jgi:syntaxin-binding protein 5